MTRLSLEPFDVIGPRHAENVRAAGARDLGPHRSLRGSICVALFALATLGCGGAGTGSGSTLPTDGNTDTPVRTLACGTYTSVGEGVVRRDGELATVPYLEVVLGDADPCSELPLVVVLHGLGDRPGVPRWPYRDLPVAVRMILPHGPIPWGHGYAWSSVRVLDHETEGLSATLAAQSDRIAAFLDALESSLPIRGGVILTGFSQGGILALTVAMQHPEHLAVVLPLAAWVPEDLRTSATASAPPIRWMHGIEDERVPYTMAVEAATDLRARGYDVELIAYEGARHAMSRAMDERFHDWLAHVLSNLSAEQPPADGLVLVP